MSNDNTLCANNKFPNVLLFKHQNKLIEYANHKRKVIIWDCLFGLIVLQFSKILLVKTKQYNTTVMTGQGTDEMLNKTLLHIEEISDIKYLI